MRAELAAALEQAGAAGSAEALATAWARRFEALVSSINQGAPWRSTDDLNAEALADVLRDGPSLPSAAVRRLALTGHRLRPWPDSQAALRRLADRFAIVALSNGNLSMLTDMFAAGGLTWHCVLSGETMRAYKPDPAVLTFRAGPAGARPAPHTHGRGPSLGLARGRGLRDAHRFCAARG